MSDTYIGWDGYPYPWPPPDGWYLAVDGRWWAPGTGPGPDPTTAPGMLTTDDPLDPATLVAGNVSSSRLASGDTVAMPSFAEPGSGSSNPYGPPTHARSPDGEAEGSSGLRSVDVIDPDLEGLEPITSGAPNRMLLAIAGVLAIVALGAGVFLLSNRGDGTAADSAVTTAAPDTATTPPPTDPAGADTSATIDTSVAPSTDTTAPGDTVAPVESTITPEATQLVADFRARLLANELTSDQLTDLQIQTFGTSFCVFAQESETSAEFDVYRQQAIERTETALGPEALALVIDVAVAVFCPEDAARLGISV